MEGLTRQEVEYRKNNDVMFSIDDPFESNNKMMKKLLVKKENNKIIRGFDFWKENGTFKTIKRLIGK